jgi:hypothetical protein
LAGHQNFGERPNRESVQSKGILMSKTHNAPALRLPPSVRRLAHAALFAAAVSLASTAFPAIAAAEAVWDIEEFDYCLRQTNGNPTGSTIRDPIAREEDNERYCCYRSGGVHNGNNCVAPPAKDAGAAPPPPPKVGLPVVSVQPPIVAPPKTPLVGRPALRADVVSTRD